MAVMSPLTLMSLAALKVRLAGPAIRSTMMSSVIVMSPASTPPPFTVSTMTSVPARRTSVIASASSVDGDPVGVKVGPAVIFRLVVVISMSNGSSSQVPPSPWGAPMAGAVTTSR